MVNEESQQAGTNVVTKTFDGSVDDAVDRLVGLAQGHGMTVFVVVDHSGEARRAGLELRDTKVVVFGSPIAGTPVMEAHPLAALDLPLKVLAWDDRGRTKISYLDPAVLAVRHHLSPELAARLAGIGPLTDELIG
jgi:uncharacterized protein (DUF302 family)